MGLRSAVVFAVCVSASMFAQDVVTVPAKTRVVVQTKAEVNLQTLKVGDPVELTLVHPLRAGTRVVLAAGSAMQAHVRSVSQKPLGVELSVDPMVLAEDRPLPVSGNPLASKKGKLLQYHEQMPKELDWHYRPTVGEAALLGGVGIVALPIVAVAAPIYLVSKAFGGDNPDPVVKAGHRAELFTTADVQVPVAALAADPTAYVGQPVVYLTDRMHQKHGRVYCGSTAYLGDKHTSTVMLRLEPGEYTFHSERKDETTATVKSEANGRYLVYHDHDGLHAVSLQEKPELLDYLPGINEKTKFSFDVTKADALMTGAMERDRARGGCGLVKSLHARRPAETSSK